MSGPDGVRRLTSPAAGAVAVLEVSGAEPCARLAALAGRELPAPGRLTLAPLAVGGALLDEALLVGREARRVEVQLHGGPAVVARVVEALGGPAPTAAPRTWREAALARLPAAPSEDGARILLDQAEGALERALAALVERPEPELVAGLEALVERGRRARPLLVAPRIVLAGPTNAGKSTLFNALLGSERALTSDVPGTTRDAVVEPARLGRLGVELVDTAGERAVDPTVDPAAAVEAAGQRLATGLRRGADLVLWLSTDGAEPPPAGPVPVVRLRRVPGGERCDGARDVVAPLEDPAGTRALVAARVAERLPHEPWSAGRAVPFEPEGLAALADLAAGGVGADRRRRALARLVPGPDRA